MSGAASIRVNQALKRSFNSISPAVAVVDDDSHSQFIELYERYKDVPHLRETIAKKLGDSFEMPVGVHLYQLLMLLKKHEKEQLQTEVLFERYRAIAIQQDLAAKDVIIAKMKEQYDSTIAQLKSQYEALLNAHSGVDKIHQENEMLKAAVFEAKRETASLQQRLEHNTLTLSGGFQTRIHEIRDRSTKLINDEHAKLAHHIRGELRKDPINKDVLLDGINEHVDNIRLAVGMSII